MKNIVAIILSAVTIIACQQKDNNVVTGKKISDSLSLIVNAKGNFINEMAPDSLKNKSATTESSIITCPHCGYKKSENLPTEVCLITYTCKGCKKELHPKEGDCCVFCSYGDHKCPSMQDF